MSTFLRPSFQSLAVYTPGEQPQDMPYIKLNTNESPFPPSDGVCRAVNAGEASLLRLYPDPEGAKLRAALAVRYGVTPDSIFLSNGSDDILNFAFWAFGSPDEPALFPAISYGFYKVFADLHGIPYRAVPLREDFSVAVSDYCGRDAFIVIANPNAPTGRYLTPEDVETLVRANLRRVVLIDEAYIDFGGTSCAPLTARYKNLLVVQTFSKSRSMAGARLGFAIADRELIADLNRIKYATNPYNINRLTLAAGEAALADAAYYKANCEEIIATRAYTTEALTALGFTVVPSFANFVFAKSDWIGGEELYKRLKAKGILVRHFSDEAIAAYNRITIGTRKDMETLMATLKAMKEE